jgi:hypothetical protein
MILQTDGRDHQDEADAELVVRPRPEKDHEEAQSEAPEEHEHLPEHTLKFSSVKHSDMTQTSINLSTENLLNFSSLASPTCQACTRGIESRLHASTREFIINRFNTPQFANYITPPAGTNSHTPKCSRAHMHTHTHTCARTGFQGALVAQHVSFPQVVEGSTKMKRNPKHIDDQGDNGKAEERSVLRVAAFNGGISDKKRPSVREAVAYEGFKASLAENIEKNDEDRQPSGEAVRCELMHPFHFGEHEWEPDSPNLPPSHTHRPQEGREDVQAGQEEEEEREQERKDGRVEVVPFHDALG